MRENRPVKRRDGTAVVVAAALLVVGIIGAIYGVRLLWHQHTRDVASHRAALDRSPSYHYGITIMDRVVEVGTTYRQTTAEGACDAALADHPGRFAGYSRRLARQGCIDEWIAVNE